MNSARTMAESETAAAREQEKSTVATKEVITWEGAVVRSSYIAQGVSPMPWRVDVTGCGRPVSLHG